MIPRYAAVVNNEIGLTGRSRIEKRGWWLWKCEVYLVEVEVERWVVGAFSGFIGPPKIFKLWRRELPTDFPS